MKNRENQDERPQNRKSCNSGKKGRAKPGYSLGSNILFMLRCGAAYPSVLWILGIEVASGVAISVTGLYMAPAFLKQLESHGSLKELLLVIAGFSLVLICLNGLEAYVMAVDITGRTHVRLSVLQKVNCKVGSCSFPLLFQQEFQDRKTNAYAATKNQICAVGKFWETLHQILKNGFCFLIYLTLMVRVKPLLIVVTMVITVLGFTWTRRFDRWSYAHREEEAEIHRKDNYFYRCTKSTRLAKDIRIFGMKEWLLDIEADIWKLLRDFARRSERNNLIADIMGIVLDLLRNGIIYTYLLAVTFQGNLSAAEFLLYFTAATGFTGQVTGILSGVGQLYRQCLEIASVRELCETKEPFLLEGGRELIPEAGSACAFEFRDVTFRYPNAPSPVLEHFNLKISPGEKLAVVGLNGAGKTTLIRLLCGFFDPDSGEVLLNGVNIREYNRRDYYKLFGAVFQEFSILAGTIAENVAQSHDPDMERVKDCLEQAGIRERIERLSEKYATMLEKQVYPDEAVELSGGELQRLMLARMLYKNAPVTVLDEPTAALDALAERDIYERYGDFTKGNTSVYISHRLASTRFCDRVILLGEGGILEEGTHEELMERRGRYAELFEIQRKYYREDVGQGG